MSETLEEKLASLQTGEALAETTARIVCQALYCSLAETCEASGFGLSTGVYTVVEDNARSVNTTLSNQWRNVLDQKDTIGDDMKQFEPRDLSQNHRPKLNCHKNLSVRDKRTRIYKPSKKG